MNNRKYLEEAQIELILAAYDGDIKSVERALNDGASVNAPLPNAYFQIHPSYQISDAYRYASALHIAVARGHTDIVKLLLNNRADPNQVCNDETPLIIAAKSDNIDIANILIDHGADIKKRNRLEESPHLIACKNLYIYTYRQDDVRINKICDFLVKFSSSHLLFDALVDKDCFQSCILTAKSGPTCLALLRLIDFLEENGKHDIKKLLPEKYTFANYHLKEDIFAAIKKLPLAERIKKYDAILHDKNSAYYHIFHMKRGNIFGVSENRGVLHDIAEAWNHHNALNNRLYQAASNNDLAAMRTCIEQGADVNFRNMINDIYPIHIATVKGYAQAVRILIENGNANTEIARTKDNSTALMFAIDKANLHMVLSLLNRDAKIDTFGNAKIDFKSPLVLAVRAGSEEILNTLVNHMIDHYDIQRIVTFLQTHDTLKTCFNRAGTNSKLLAPLQKLAKYLVIHHVGSEILDSIPPEHIATPENKVDAIPETTTASLYPKLDQEITSQSDALQQYLDAAKQRQFVSLPPVLLNPLTGEPLPEAQMTEPESDPLTAIDAILVAPVAPKQPSWVTDLNEIDFSQTEPSSTAVIMNQLGDLMSFEEPSKSYVNPFDELVEQEKQTVNAKPGYINPFDEMTEAQKEAGVAAQLDALPPAPQGLGLFAARTQETSKATEKSKILMAAN